MYLVGVQSILFSFFLSFLPNFKDKSFGLDIRNHSIKMRTEL